MATRSGKFVGIDVSKDKLDVAVLGEKPWNRVDNREEGIAELVKQMQELQPELIVVEATGGYQRAVVDALFRSDLAVAVVNPSRVRSLSRVMALSPRRLASADGRHLPHISTRHWWKRRMITVVR